MENEKKDIHFSWFEDTFLLNSGKQSVLVLKFLYKEAVVHGTSAVYLLLTSHIHAYLDQKLPFSIYLSPFGAFEVHWEL
jgi:hypothetical protein